MNRVVLYSFIAAVFFGPAHARAAYVIKLKNGNEYITMRYWHEGTQVLFDTYDGIFGVATNFINKIEGSSRPAPLSAPTSAAEKPDDLNQQQTISSTASQNIDVKNIVKDQKTPPRPLKKDAEILKQYAELQNRFGQLNDLPRHEVYALDADIDSFRKKVLSSDMAEAHKEEMDALATLQKAINRYLKATNR
jgi:hypothetical protein